MGNKKRRNTPKELSEQKRRTARNKIKTIEEQMLLTKNERHLKLLEDAKRKWQRDIL